MALAINDINSCSEAEFVDLLESIFEHSRWVPELVCEQRPFASRAALHRAMCAAVRRAPELQRTALLCAHPELAGKEARDGSLTHASRDEQAGAGLDQCSADELAQIAALNRAYRERFEFPFIIAVAGLDKHRIIAEMQRRAGNDRATEFDTALAEVEKIAGIRLAALIDE